MSFASTPLLTNLTSLELSDKNQTFSIDRYKGQLHDAPKIKKNRLQGGSFFVGISLSRFSVD